MAHKKAKKPKFIRIFCALLLVCFLGYFSYMYINQSIVLNKQEKQMAQMQQENLKLEEKYQQMLKDLENKGTLSYIESYMRSHFGMVQEGQIRVDIMEEE